MKINKYMDLVDYSRGNKKPSLVLKGARLVMVQSEEIVNADIAIEDGYIVGIGSYDGVMNIDCRGKYISPGFIDAHLHFESTMANPDELVHYASLSGTTCFVADPHEAANVSGLRGVEFIIRQTENSTGKVYIMMPSCVPCMDGEDTGKILQVEDMKKMLDNDRILGLAEVMDNPAVLTCKESMMDKMDLFAKKPIDGHAPGLSDKDLGAYAMAGIMTDHECVSYDYAIKQVRNGMYVHIREGSAARNLEAIVRGIVENGTSVDRFTFCTDDKHIEDIINEGHISHNIRKAIKLGLEPLKAYKMATMNPATCYSLDDMGIISPGRRANLVILNDLENVDVESVLYEGEFIGEDYKPSHKLETCPSRYANDQSEETYRGGKSVDSVDDFSDLMDTVHIDWFTRDMLDYKSQNYAIGLVKDQILTKKIDLRKADQSIMDGLNKVLVIERHHNTGRYHVAKLSGYGIKNGAIASSVSHDSHNIIVVGDNDDDMMLAIEKIKEIHGGYVLVSQGQVYGYLPLPYMGLITSLRQEEMVERLSRMIEQAHYLGVKEGIEPFISLSFIALPVIGEVRIRTSGLYDVVNDLYLD